MSDRIARPLIALALVAYVVAFWCGVMWLVAAALVKS